MLILLHRLLQYYLFIYTIYAIMYDSIIDLLDDNDDSQDSGTILFVYAFFCSENISRPIWNIKND
jgi:hypothetical protein